MFHQIIKIINGKDLKKYSDVNKIICSYVFIIFKNFTLMKLCKITVFHFNPYFSSLHETKDCSIIKSNLS